MLYQTRRSFGFILIFLLGIASLAYAGPDISYGKDILALYKSSENQTETENEILWYVSGPLKAMGFRVKYWDIDKGIPSNSSMANTRAIVTWFRGPAMQKPEVYLDFLDRNIGSGKKVVVFENFGAYQDRRTKEYVPLGRLNITLSNLGIIYQGEWTNDPKKIRIAQKDSGMVEFQGKQNVDKSRFFYRFSPVDRELKVFLALKRKDRSYGPSPVIVTNPNGGFALNTYVFHYLNGKVTLLLNPEKFLQAALFPQAGSERIGLLVGRRDNVVSRVLDYTTGVLTRAKLPYQIIDRDQFSNLLPGDLNRFTALGLILRDDSSLDPDLLDNFLKAGKGVISLVKAKYNNLSEVLGTKNTGATGASTEGYRFRVGFLLGEGLYLENKEFLWQPGQSEPSQGADVLATSVRGSSPLLWSTTRHGGKALIWNWDAFYTGEFQGFILESFLYVMPVGVAATPGIGIMFIDDWPLPMYNLVKSPLKITDTRFYTGVWWPEIKKLLKRYGIAFSCYLVFNYNANTSPPFITSEFYVAEDLGSVKVARGIIEDGIELGFHGYNHVSLTREVTSSNAERWPTEAAMEESLERAKTEWINLFGEHSLPVTYVAPHNIISREGMQAVHNTFPSIKVISTLRAGLQEESYAEFGHYAMNPELYAIPRTSSGYPFTPEVKQLIVAAILGPGVWAHFIHADDVFDPNRSKGKDWPALKAEFVKMIEFVQLQYPWLEYYNTRDAYQKLQRFDETGVEFRREGTEIAVNTAPGLKFRLRLNQSKAKRIDGAKVLHRYRKMNYLILEATSPQVRITLSQ